MPLDVGRRVRSVTPAIRRALDHRDGGCTWLGCDAHHIVHWADGGEISPGGMRLLCRKHHTCIHEADERKRKAGDAGIGSEAEP